MARPMLETDSHLTGRRVLVTGGAGFIGSHLAARLAEGGATVTVFDDLSAGFAEQVPEGVRFVRGDVRDRAAVEAAVRGQSWVFHFAANASVPVSVDDPDLDFTVNALGSQVLFRACAGRDVERVVFASSAAVYGNATRIPIPECSALLPVSPYGASKLAAERLGAVYASVYGLPFTAVRIFNTYGERSRRYVIYDLLRRLAKRTDRLELLGDGTQRRDFCHVPDACETLVRVAAADGLRGESINLAAGSPITIRALADVILEALGLLGRTEVSCTGVSWPGDIGPLIGDPTRIRDVTGYSPTVSLVDGIARVAAWLERTDGWRPAR